MCIDAEISHRSRDSVKSDSVEVVASVSFCLRVEVVVDVSLCSRVGWIRRSREVYDASII